MTLYEQGFKAFLDRKVTTQQDLLQELYGALRAFEELSSKRDIRVRVQRLVPARLKFIELGKSSIPSGLELSARDRLLIYFKTYPHTVLTGDELCIVAGISEWARRVRELRVQFGWKIMSGLTAGAMKEEVELPQSLLESSSLRADDYILLDEEQDRDSAFRWNMASEIRKRSGSMKHRILEFLRANVGKPVAGEELQYVAKGSEWARRVRELRAEDGWPISTQMSGNPSLPPGVYVLERDRQSPRHDRRIKESIRREALRRDNYRCRICGWSHSLWNPSDPRSLEIHHIKHHARGGDSSLGNLITYCHVCHDAVHADEKHHADE